MGTRPTIPAPTARRLRSGNEDSARSGALSCGVRSVTLGLKRSKTYGMSLQMAKARTSLTLMGHPQSRATMEGRRNVRGGARILRVK